MLDLKEEMEIGSKVYGEMQHGDMGDLEKRGWVL